MAYDNNFGSNPSPAWELSPHDLSVLASYVNQDKAEEASYDDLFDDAVYHAAQTTFHAQAHEMMPQGQTHYRGVVEHTGQGIPTGLSTAHWEWLPDSGTQKRPDMYAGTRLAYAIARDSARPESSGWRGMGAPAPRGPDPAAAYAAPYSFTG